jgi:hypothetical protein
MSLLLGLGAALGSGSIMRLFLPTLLVAFYFLRGVQVMKGDVTAARRLLWLHVIGGGVACLNMASATGVVMGFHAVKLIIHLFGGITAEWARRSGSPA